jgi:hypothetical protein
LAGIIRNHAALNIQSASDDDGPFFRVTCRRRHVLQDGLRHMKQHVDSDKMCPLRVTFLNECGVDAGGLRREFASIYCSSFSRSSLLQGISGYKSFSHDSLQLASGSYRHAGQLFALTILQGGSGPRCFCQAVTSYICNGEASSAGIDDVPTEECRMKLVEVTVVTSLFHYTVF